MVNKPCYTEGKTDKELIGHIGFGEPVEVDYNAKKKILLTAKNSYVGKMFTEYVKEHYVSNFEIEAISTRGDDWKSLDFSKYDIVFHVAGLAHADVGNVSDEVKQNYYKVNTELTVELANKAKQDGVREFIFTSSMIVYGDSAPYGKKKVIDENTVPSPANFYGDSKLQADVAIRELADENFKVIVLRPPMIYGKESKGNYSTLAKLAKKLPLFPDVDNERSMLHIDNLCEFLCQIMLVKEMTENAVVLIPQNAEWIKTSDMVKEIAEVSGKNIKETSILTPVVAIGGKVSGKTGGLINKAFGNNCYDWGLSIYPGIDYQTIPFHDSIVRTEGNAQKKTPTNVCLINCFDTYEHRVDLLHDYFKNRGSKVSVYTSDFRHFEKCRRADDKTDFKYFHAIPYAKNMSADRLRSHIALARDIFTEVEKQNFDLLWVMLPPNSFAKEAAKYKENHKEVKLIFDLIDLWPETMPISKFKSLPPFTYWKNLRDSNLNVADEIVTECNLYHQRLPKSVQHKLHTIYLAREIKEFHPHLNLPEDRISLCYLGSINNIIDIPAIADLIQDIKKYKPVEIHIVGDGEKKEELILACEEAGAKVVYHGKVYDADEKQRIFDSCHYGLNFMKDSVFVGLTMKSMDYFEAGLPIINNIHGDTWKFIDEYNLGYNISDFTEYDALSNYNQETRIAVRLFFEDILGLRTFSNKISELLLEKNK